MPKYGQKCQEKCEQVSIVVKNDQVILGDFYISYYCSFNFLLHYGQGKTCQNMGENGRKFCSVIKIHLIMVIDFMLYYYR